MGANLIDAGGLSIDIKFLKISGHQQRWPGPFQGPSSYPELCWWSLIKELVWFFKCPNFGTLPAMAFKLSYAF
jgi:hypothetical protein